MRYCILIPSFNEEKTIGWLVKSVREMGYDVMVVDDGSSDRTATIAGDSGAEVVVNEQNLGKGASLRRAFKLLVQRDYDAVLVMDGDGQHHPKDMRVFFKVFEEEGAGIVVGNRMLKPRGMPLIRWLTNRFMSWMLSKICKQDIPDSQCGFRLIKKNVLERLSLSTEKFEIESEMLLRAAQNGYSIKSVPIRTIYQGQYSAIHPVKDTIRFFNLLFKKNETNNRLF